MASVQGQVLPDTGSRLVLRSRLGAITLVLLCAVQFLDIADSAIVNVALPSIQHSLGFSQQNLQWVASGYILTYGGFLLLGGRLGDLLGRRRMLLTGLAVFAVSSLTAGLASSAGTPGRRPARSRYRRRAHGPGGALGAHDQLPRGQGPQYGARGMGSRQRDGRRGRRLPRRSASRRDQDGDGSSSSTRRSVSWWRPGRSFCSRETAAAGPGRRPSTPRGRCW